MEFEGYPIEVKEHLRQTKAGYELCIEDGVTFVVCCCCGKALFSYVENPKNIMEKK